MAIVHRYVRLPKSNVGPLDGGVQYEWVKGFKNDFVD